MKEPRTIHERVARANASSHLEHEPDPCAIDLVGALGMAGVTNVLSAAVFRLKYGNEARFYGAALVAVTRVSKQLSKKNGWVGTQTQLAGLNRSALDYWLDDGCRDCDRLGYRKVVGAPVLSDDACPVCRGTRKRPLPRQRSPLWRVRFLLLLAHLDELEADAGVAVIARLANSVRQFKAI